MSRAAGKHGPRQPELSPEQQHEFGIDTRDIPGGAIHIVNHPTVHHKPPVPEKLAEFRGDMAHGVPPSEHGHRDREVPATRKDPYTGPPAGGPPPAVPVYIVERGLGEKAITHTVTNRITVPVAGSTPVMLCGADHARSAVLLLAEGANVVRFADNLAQLAGPVGQIPAAALPINATSYLRLGSQDKLYAITDAATAGAVSIIREFDTRAAG